MDAERRLLDEREVTQRRLRQLQHDFGGIVDASRDSNADDEHDPEGATIAFERAQVDALAKQARRHLDEIEAALDRLREGTYGICSRCGGEVPPERLEVRPVARSCVRCA